MSAIEPSVFQPRLLSTDNDQQLVLTHVQQIELLFHKTLQLDQVWTARYKECADVSISIGIPILWLSMKKVYRIRQ